MSFSSNMLSINNKVDMAIPGYAEVLTCIKDACTSFFLSLEFSHFWICYTLLAKTKENGYLADIFVRENL